MPAKVLLEVGIYTANALYTEPFSWAFYALMNADARRKRFGLNGSITAREKKYALAAVAPAEN
jgi:hypothetical protein